MRRIAAAMWVLICLLTMSFAVWKLWGYHSTYRDGKMEYDNLTEYIDETELLKAANADKEPGKNRCPVTVDFKSLRKINPDVVGWIHIPDTGIDYPIVQAKENRTYLHKTFKGKDSYVGAIFLDALCKPDFSSFNSIIYGHNLKNGEMFGHLKKLYDTDYNPKADYKKHPIIWIISPDDAYEYTIFAFREVDVKSDGDVYTVDLPDAKDCRSFLDEQIGRSQKDTGIWPSEYGRMITLSTCTSRTENERFVVQASVLREH